MDGFSLLRLLTLSSMAPHSFAFVPPMHSLSDIRYLPVLRPTSTTLDELRKPAAPGRRREHQHHQPQRPSWNRVLNTPPECSSSAAASSQDASSPDEDPWLSELARAAESSSTPYFGPNANVERMRLSDIDGDIDGGDREASPFAPKPLREGRVVRPMRESDVDGVVVLAFAEFYEGPIDMATGAEAASLGGWRVWEETWRRARLNGGFDQADVDRLTDG